MQDLGENVCVYKAQEGSVRLGPGSGARRPRRRRNGQCNELAGPRAGSFLYIYKAIHSHAKQKSLSLRDWTWYPIYSLYMYEISKLHAGGQRHTRTSDVVWVLMRGSLVYRCLFVCVRASERKWAQCRLPELCNRRSVRPSAQKRWQPLSLLDLRVIVNGPRVYASLTNTPRVYVKEENKTI